MAKEDEDCQRLTEIPRVGPVTATALIAAVACPHRNGVADSLPWGSENLDVQLGAAAVYAKWNASVCTIPLVAQHPGIRLQRSQQHPVDAKSTIRGETLK
jgi:hypothetical protein